NASAVVAAGTERGNEVMARLAARMGLPLAANCIDAEPGDPTTVMRQRWGGSLLEEARLHSPRPLMTVAPHTVAADSGPPPAEVYLACGISGATQHMAGLKGAKRILAINSDPQAPLMLNADYTVTGDLKEIVPAISAEIRKRR